jgi:hypothetical protein
MNDTDARLWHPGSASTALAERWSAEAGPQVKAAFAKALALRSHIRRAGWLN